ncbi:hypothetical protein CMO83_03100 [Candidatus Woesearchaeota archaeon]|jgi:hypothetical protein|nr:hypothetical protein [Candidatus Woesearchaeota archaeon]|tara:strand:+ start:16312 stop:16644 length:333 start_codon:yes stop_codon:yes gene_type:complete
MSDKKPIVVPLEREVRVGAVVFDLTMLLGCNTSTLKPLVQLEDMTIANYWLSKGGTQPPMYQVSCRGVIEQGKTYLEKAYHFEVATILGEPISEELEARVIDTIRKAPSD